jgi:PAS domain-containing protein
LFQVANDAVLVLDAASFQVLEANPAAGSLLGAPVEALSGRTLRQHIDRAMQPTLDELLVTARATGHATEVRLRVAGPGTPIDMSATPFRADEQHCLLLRARRAEASANDPQAVLDFMGQTPDAVVVTDSAGRVLWANRAFVEMCEAPDETRLKGRPLADALGGEPLQWASLLARVRSRGIIGQTHVALRMPGAPPLLASVSAALLAEGDQEHIGFTLRPAGDAAALPAAADALASDIQALGARLGELTLEQLLAQASRMAELHFIQAALRASGGQLDTAARTLAVSKAMLLQRMHELGLPPPMPAGGKDRPGQVN